MDPVNTPLTNITGHLKLPARQFDHLSFCGLEQEEIQEFINSLPYTNPPELCKQLYELLPQLAGLAINPGKKLAILDAFLAVTMNCVDKLTINTQLSEKTTTSVSLAQALLKHLADGYKAIAVEASKAREVVPKVLADSIFAAMSIMNRAILNCWQCYLATPEYFWTELHNLYKLARHFKLENHGIKLANSDQTVALRSAYIKPLLMSSINPGRHTPTDLRSIFRVLDQLTNLADLSRDCEGSIFVIDTAGNAGPVYSSRVRGITANMIGLRTQRLVAALQLELEEGREAQYRLPDRLVRNLCEYWDSEKIRRDEHHEDETEVLVVFGLSAVHRLLSKTGDLDEFLLKLDEAHHGKDYALFSGRKAGHLQDLASVEDVWHDAYDSMDSKANFAEKVKPTAQTIDFQKVAVKAPKERKKIRGYKGIRVNTSKRGACIEFQEPPANLSPGELLYVKEKAGGQWRLGLIRWQHVTPKLHRLTGVEFVHGTIEPCAACVMKMDRPVSPYLPGLLISDGSHSEVILPSMPFKINQRVRLLSMAAEKICPLRKVLDATFHLTRFHHLTRFDIEK